MPPAGPEPDVARRFAQYMGFLAGFDFVLSSALLIMCGDQVGRMASNSQQTLPGDTGQPKVFNSAFWNTEVSLALLRSRQGCGLSVLSVHV